MMSMQSYGQMVPSGIQSLGIVVVIALLTLALGVGTSNVHAASTSVSTSDIVGVVGGEIAETQQFPSMVALVSPDDGQSLRTRQFCGGTLIAPQWVITAAHCFFDISGNRTRQENVRVVSGINNLFVEVPDEEAVVSTIYLHPDYDHFDQLVLNDIALLELATVQSSTPTSLFSADVPSIYGEDAITVGWGATSDSQLFPGFPSALRFGVVPIVSMDVCNDPSAYNGMIHESQICAGFAQGGVDSCSGDSGGPLFVEQDGQRTLVGVVSFGDGCARPDAYGIYTNVSFFRSWIEQYVELEPTSAENSSNLSSGGARNPNSGENNAAEANLTDNASSNNSTNGLGAGLDLLVLMLFVAIGRLTARTG